MAKVIYLGDSGKNQMKINWRALGQTCKMEGILHPQLVGIAKVPRVTPAATMAPMNQDELNRDPIRARSFGYASSPIIDDAATIAKGIPKPKRNRAMTNIATVKNSCH